MASVTCATNTWRFSMPEHDESRQPFTPGDSLHLRKALVTARRVELGHAKTARHHKDDASLALATRQAEIYSGLISKIDARHVPTN